ncbi:MAG: DUF4031 domain-containing protein [Acidimicrobiales bacterium]|mgnify:CR=1 FL=1|jgi:hypothetical protein|nr:DUF4031 domain-containing protein [Acidimicrobiales bacterium]HJM29206.1 DUF4031 domain-containing protein [Acidimicrobiales bacterium]HJM96751.1 DUF4031 domain-containing protein [Acidimicrobiales bacterium]|tara:strand:+ start:531 stop:893 length:363 start_codon:yes stop_codon:yes gene_type:complete
MKQGLRDQGFSIGAAIVSYFFFKFYASSQTEPLILFMTILIDKPIWLFRGELWSHLVSDASYEELHNFAAVLGVPRSAFQGDHYDIPERIWLEAVELGAVQTEPRELVRRLKDSGLRKRP